MSDDGSGPPALSRLRVRLTGILMMRQLGLLFLVALLLTAQVYLMDFYGQIGPGLRNEGPWVQTVTFGWFTLPILVAGVFAFVFATGIVFAAGPSERSFTIFLLLIIAATGAANYDHSILDWFLAIVPKVAVTNSNPVSVLKVLLGAGMFAAVVLMHYNILADDFTRRLLGRGVAAEEVVPVRRHMVRLLLPVLFSAGAVAVTLGLVGEFSQLVFQGHGLFAKFEIVVLGGLGVAIGYVLLQILRAYYAKRKHGANVK
jgi:hypothetical protein